VLITRPHNTLPVDQDFRRENLDAYALTLARGSWPFRKSCRPAAVQARPDAGRSFITRFHLGDIAVNVRVNADTTSPSWHSVDRADHLRHVGLAARGVEEEIEHDDLAAQGASVALCRRPNP
jgi:hypothetical protein